MNLDHIKTSLHCKFCSGTKSGGDALNLFDGQVGDIGAYLLIEQGTQFFHGNSFGEHTGDISDHSLKVGIGLMQLGTDFTSLRMKHIGQGSVIIKSLFGIEEGPKREGSTGTSPMIIMAHPPQAIFLRSSSCSVWGSPSEVGAKMMRFLREAHRSLLGC